MAFTRMPYFAHSQAKLFVSIDTPDFDAQYPGLAGKPVTPAIDERLTIEPPPFLIMLWAPRRAIQKVPARLTAIVRRNSSSVRSCVGRNRSAIAALFITTSTGPKVSIASFTARRAPDSCLTSAQIRQTKLGSTVSKASASELCLSITVTRSPKSMNLRDIAYPIPLAPPVMITCRPPGSEIANLESDVSAAYPVPPKA